MRRSSIVVVVVALLAAYSIQEKITRQDASNYAFSEAGHMWLATSYSHLVVPLSIYTLERKLDMLKIAVGKLEAAQRAHSYPEFESIYLKAAEDLFLCQQGFDDLKYFLKKPSPTRQKRFLGALLGGAIAGLVSGSLFGSFNAARLSQIERSLHDTEKARLQLVHVTERIANNSAHNSAHILALESMLKSLTRQLSLNRLGININFVYTNIQRMTNVIRDEITLYTSVFAKLAEHRLAMGFVHPDQIEKSLEALEKLAAAKQYHLGISIPQHVFQLEASLLFGNDTDANIVLHTPLVRKNMALKLLAYHPFPIKSLKHGYDIIIKPENNFLALTMDDELYAEFSLSDLQLCQEISKHYVCPSLQVLKNRHSNPSCLTTLYFSNAKNIHRFCDLRIRPAADSVVPLQNNTFLAHHQHPVAAKETCLVDGSKKTKTFQVDNVERITVPDNCFVTLPDFSLYSIAEIPGDVTISTYRWQAHFDDIVPNLKPEEITAIMEKFHNRTTLAPVDPDIYKGLRFEFAQMNKTHYIYEWPTITSLSLGGGSAIMVFIIIIMVVAAGCYKRKINARNLAATAPINMNVFNPALGPHDEDPLLAPSAPRMPNAIPPQHRL